MDNTAIEAIAKLAINEANQSADFILTYGDQKLNDLEKFKPFPNRFRGTFTTSLLEQFALYVTAQANIDTSLFINHIEGTAEAIIDQGSISDPHWGNHRAKLFLLKLPEYAALLDNNDKALNQRVFIDLIEDYANAFAFFDSAGNPLDTSTVINNLHRLKVDTTRSAENNIGNYAAAASAMEKIEMKAAGNSEPPSGFVFNFRPYENFRPFSAKCLMRAVNDGDAVRLKYRIIGLEVLKKEIADVMLTLIDEKTEEVSGLKIYIGDMRYQNT